MSTIHRLTYFFQFGLLLGEIAILFFANPSTFAILVFFSIFFLSELFLVHQQTKMKAEAIYYQKSCAFALGDLAGASVYLAYFLLLVGQVIFKYAFGPYTMPLIILFTYTLIRKIYIFNNYSYEI